MHLFVSGMTTIERPHGAGTLVIRPSGPHHQGALLKPHHSKPPYASTAFSGSTTSTTSTTTTDDPSLLWTSNIILGDLQSSASIASATTSNFKKCLNVFTLSQIIGRHVCRENLYRKN